MNWTKTEDKFVFKYSSIINLNPVTQKHSAGSFRASAAKGTFYGKS
jgi:hypothetical protein